jgi:hypothetical protein
VHPDLTSPSVRLQAYCPRIVTSVNSPSGGVRQPIPELGRPIRYPKVEPGLTKVPGQVRSGRRLDNNEWEVFTRFGTLLQFVLSPVRGERCRWTKTRRMPTRETNPSMRVGKSSGPVLREWGSRLARVVRLNRSNLPRK